MALAVSTASAREALDALRRASFLEKADIGWSDARLRSLRESGDAGLGIDEALLARAVDAFGLTGAGMARSASQGTFHRLFEVGTAPGAPRLLRVAVDRGEAAAGLMALECRVMEALRARGLPVPACECRSLGEGGQARGVQLLERLPGESLAAIDADEPRMTASLATAAGFLSGLHAIRGNGFGPLSAASLDRDAGFVGVHPDWESFVCRRLDEHLGACAAAGDIDGLEASAIAAAFAAQRARLCGAPAALLHGDPGSHNFVFDGASIAGVIDWEDALLGDPLFELASLCTFHPERRHAAIWSGYGFATPLVGEAWARFWLYFLRIALAKTVHRRRFGYADLPGREPASRRIQLALQRLRVAA